jgi:nitroreductase
MGVLEKLSQAAHKRWENRERMSKIVGENYHARTPVYRPFRNARTVIFVSHRKQDVQPGIEYCNVTTVVHTMHLAAADLGLASVYVWGALESMREIPELDNTEALKLPAGFEPLLGICIGYPAEPLKPRELKPDKFTIDYL